MGQTTDSVAITVTSTRLIISQNGISLVFGGQDIIRAEAVNAPSHPPVNTVSNAWFIRLYLTGPIREVYPTGYYDILLNAVSSPSSWNDKIDPRAGALIALAAITPMIRSAPSGGGGGGQVDTIVAGDAIDVDATDPVNPIVAVKVDGVTIGFNGSNELQVPAGGGGYVPTSRTIGTTAPLTGGGDLSANRTIAIPQANGSTSGYLASGDWTTFNNKQAAGNYLTDLTGDVTASGPGSAASTIANNAVTFAKMQAVSANILLGNDAAGTAVEEIACTAAGRALIDDATAADQRTTLGLGTAATVNTGTGAGDVPTITQADARYSRFIVKPTNTDRTNNTLSADPHLVLPMAANTGYSGVIILFISASAAGDFKSRITGPAAPNYVLLAQASAATTGTTQTNRVAAAYDSTDLTQTNTVDFVGRIQIQFTVQNGANAGNLTVEWAQNSTSANPTTLLAGSSIEYMQF